MDTPPALSAHMSNLSRLGREERNRRESLGEYLGPLPLGYRRVRKSLGLEIVIDEEVAAHIRFGFALAAIGKHSVRAICAELTCLGLRGQRGEPLGPSTLWRILTNPFYAGLRESHAGELVTGSHPAVVDRHTFERAGKELARRRRSLANECRAAITMRDHPPC